MPAPGPLDYQPRIADDDLRRMLEELPAVSIDGPRAVGKTRTALRHAGTVYALDDPDVLAAIRNDPKSLARGEPPILIDEWQRYPASWDIVRRAVDQDFSPCRFILTGSTRPPTRPTHSGAGRIVRLRMWTTTLAERAASPGRQSQAAVSLRELLTGERPDVSGSTDLSPHHYAEEIVSGGFPGWRYVSGRARRLLIEGYLHDLAEHDFPLAGRRVRNPAALRRWMTAYAAAVSTTASYETIRDAATSGEGDKSAKTTTIAYRDTLEAMWLLEPLPAWIPGASHLRRLKRAPKHHLADTALATRLLDATPDTLVSGQADASLRYGPGAAGLFGSLFESLVTHDLRVYAQSADARVSHLRTWNDQREVDLIIEGERGVVAVEVKAGSHPSGRDTRHLRWLADRLGPRLLDAMVVTTGASAYRDKDGIAVVPAALLGP